MKVVHVVRQFHPSIGGMEDVVFNIAMQLHLHAGIDVDVVTLNRVFTQSDVLLPCTDKYQGVSIQRIGYRGSSRYPLAPWVLRMLDKADVIHVHGIDFFYDFLALTRVLHGKPMVVSTHGGFFHTDYASRLKLLWFNTLTRLSALAYARIIASSESDGALFSKIVAPSRLRVIENGVDVEKYARCGSSEAGRTLLYFGRWSMNKGLLETLQLLAVLYVLDPRWRLIIAGREYDYDQAALAYEVDRLGLSEQVHFHCSPSQSQLRFLMEQAQFFISLSRHEGFGIAAVEAMSAGLIPVLSDIPPFARLHRESGLGVLVDPLQPQQAAVAVQGLAVQVDTHFIDWRSQAMAFSDRYHWRYVIGCYQDEYCRALGLGGEQEFLR
ncbi:glycosyltransferase family 4 protein [Xylella fastidiosa]|uniref:glycosyltransferase family 4 protein n=1 Tax=Xylella fastidiosa TaxID=2371 RepID=UPI000765EFC8|nr:glycosyltransferase family 4 protein [Xylella fastidiosa]ALR01421.1 glycosyl transferase family 1 [Xylella fastidiosa]KXB15771.1 glycosyl transferase family 1 [Xylella fastidiosa]KXB20098.1 glycosyl transferase family 1 [Xylella fastidiosa]MDG5823832.1 glycosyltransferase family 4 protein [Xylella fastidiosa subsp. pauca]MDG5824897.1 glycosyltransferase family 4 protein [Xylella fastidiosa subsp. pauca]